MEVEKIDNEVFVVVHWYEN